MECSKLYILAVRLAARQHAAAIYDGKPFYVHFEDLEQVLEDHGLSTESRRIQANLHDIIEGGDTTYNDIKKIFGLETAEVVYLCSDNKGRVREDRKNQPFYDEIKFSKFRQQATLMKLVDRVSNSRRSTKNGHGMGNKYKQEYAHFKTELFVSTDTELTSLWNELDELMGF
jgi:(p)ppGpp synthase/HD superfamily hydrolase